MSTTRLTDEQEYFEQRDEQLARRLGREQGLSRRDLLKLGAAGSLLLGAGAFGRPGWAAAQQAPAGPIVKPLPPEWFTPIGTNAEMRWEAMRGQGYYTPSERFFVRNHTATPLIDKRSWRLRIFGRGLRRPEGIELDYRDLLRLPARSRAAFIECAGNGRSYFTSQQGTPASGSQWKLGAIGVAHWRGVPLGEVLERAGISRRAVDVMPQGLDATVVSNGVDQGHVRRPLPVGKALDDVLLAYEMNGKPLPPDHGAPVRLVVPGWVGIASIKWLGQIEVADEPLFSPWNTTQYRMVGPDYPPDSPPLTSQQVKSAFELPWENATLPAGRTVTLHGRSWSGDKPIRRVDVRVDAAAPPTVGAARHGHDGLRRTHGHDRPLEPGDGWQRAHLHGPNLPQAWVRWSVDVRLPAAGAYGLLARATDRAGTTQPDTVPFNANGYQFWALVRHPVAAAA
jgi:DMSO/TMAO reductase YedYZ molybdopterin-dependent catalytic subunit